MPDPTDWLLTKRERGNPATRLDDQHPGEQAWSEGNLVRPLVHGATYFAELFERIEATREGDLVFFTDWQGDADERLTGEPGSEVAEVLGRADERGVDVRGLVWRSHSSAIGFTSDENLRLGRTLQKRGAEAILDMRVRTGRLAPPEAAGHPAPGRPDARHRLRRRHRPVPLAPRRRRPRRRPAGPRRHGRGVRRDPALARHPGGRSAARRCTTSRPSSASGGRTPPRLSRSPVILLRDRLRGLDTTPDPLPEQAPPPPPVDGGTHVVQLLRTYPNLRRGRDYDFARGGERSVARGYTKAVERARHLIYVEDQYLWGDHVGSVFTEALRAHPDLHVIAVVPMLPDVEGFSRTAQLVGRRRAMLDMARVAPDRVAIYGIENHAGTPVYVHAKACIVDDTWTTIGSDNFNRRSWTHDSELSAVVLDTAGDYARTLRLTLAAEHLDRDDSDERWTDCVEPAGMFAAYAECAAALDGWHAGGRVGPRPPGRLRRLEPPELGPVTRALAVPFYLTGARPGRAAQAAAQADEF